MAQVPYSEGVQSVEPRGAPPEDYQRIQATPAMFGGEIATGLEKAGAGATAAGKFFGQVAADDAYNQLQDFGEKLYHGDPTKVVGTGPDGQPQYDTGFKGLTSRAALDARQSVEQAFDGKMKEIRQGLQTPDQEFLFDQYSRRYRAVLTSQIGDHADQQTNNWYAEVEQDSALKALKHVTSNADDFTLAQNGIKEYIGARLKTAQRMGAQPGDEVWTQTRDEARAVATKTWIEAVEGRGNWARAEAMIEKNRDTLGELYPPLAERVRAGANRQNAEAIGTQSLAAPQPLFAPPVNDAISVAAAGTGISPQTLYATARIESGGNPAAQKGSYKGLFQLSDADFAKYGQGDIWNPKDNALAAARMLKDQSTNFKAQYGRDATPFDLYMLHQQGAGGYAAQTAHPDQPAWQNMLSTAEGQQKGEFWAKAAIWGNMTPRDQARYGTVDNVIGQDFLNIWRSHFMNASTALPDRAIAYDRAMAQIRERYPQGNPQLEQETHSWIDRQYQMQEASVIDQERAIKLQEAQQKQASEKAKDDIIRNVLSDNPSINARAIAANNALTPEAKMQMVNFVGRANRPDPLGRISHETSVELMRRIRLPDNDPQKITDDKPILDAFNNDRLGKDDLNFLRKEILDVKTPEGEALSADRKEFITRYAGTIDGALGEDGRHSALGEQQIYRVERALKARETELKGAGKNPRDLYDPSSKEFFGAPANIRRYQISLSEAQKYQDQIGKPSAVAEPAGPAAPAPSSAVTPEKAAAVAATPIRAVNRTTGQALILQNNQWMPEPIAPVRSELPQGAAPDYDYAGAQAAGVRPDERGHLPDTYKLPNHITFSDESKYSNVEHQGGHWRQIEGNHWEFTPGPENLKHHSMPELRDYFRQYEPESTLVAPK